MIFHSISANWLIFCQRGGGPRIFVKYSPVILANICMLINKEQISKSNLNNHPSSFTYTIIITLIFKLSFIIYNTFAEKLQRYFTVLENASERSIQIIPRSCRSLHHRTLPRSPARPGRRTPRSRHRHPVQIAANIHFI